MVSLYVSLRRREFLRRLTALTAVLVSISTLSVLPVFADPDTALEDYVDQPDPVFSFTPLSSQSFPGVTAYILQLTSQKWRSAEEVDRTLWEHTLTIFIPDTVVSDKSFMFVLGGDNGDGPPEPDSLEAQVLARFAIESSTVVSAVQQVPNQPLIFTEDKVPNNARDEDELVAFTFDRATRTGDYTWPAYLPMVKSVVRAMDTVESFVQNLDDPAIDVSQFVVAGFSKRAAAAWLTAAVDERVIAIAPVVFDVLNWAPSLENHRASYGFVSNALEDYQEFDLIDRLRTPEGQDLLKIVDPFSYRDQLTIPKYIVNSSGDEFFTPDSSLFYIDALPGETLIRYVPNTNHGGEEGGLETQLQGILGWYQRIVGNAPTPQINWSLDADGTLRVTTTGTPNVLLWQAINPIARDFRFDELGPIWFPTRLKGADGEYVTQLMPPPSGWSAFFVELTFTEPPQVYTTPTFITPTEKPFSLVQPINSPQSAYFWMQEFTAASGGVPWYEPTYDAVTLRNFLPVRVFNQYISTLDEAHAALQFEGSIKHQALRQCLAARMNIEAEEIDWYSPVRFFHIEQTFLWQRWNKAHRRFLNGEPGKAVYSCAVLNFQ